ncbi:MAG TPA: phosphoribosyltransferase family protein [Bryobacteraceae bacterium]|nr:phosphoribosyltransferase family protein [Bryobacteraceae bacterium]
MVSLPFENREEAGRLLAAAVAPEVRDGGAVVAALPRGGIPVAREVAQALGAPLDVALVRKLGVPGQEELAFGAIASEGQQFIDQVLVEVLQLTPAVVQEVVREQEAELERRERLYRSGREPVPVQGRTVILVDDGMATGSTMIVAIRAQRQRGAARIIVAVPVASRQAVNACRAEGAECICLAAPHPFHAVGQWYEDFTQVSDQEVQRTLNAAQAA